MNCYLIEIQVSTIRFSVYYQQYTIAILSFVQRGISYIKTQYTIVKNETYMYTSEYTSTILQVSGMFLSVFVLTLSSSVTHTDQNWHQLTRWITIGWHQERHDKWKCAMTNKYASTPCRRTGTVPGGRWWNENTHKYFKDRKKKILLSGRLNFSDASHAASVTAEHFLPHATPFNMFFFWF